MPTANEALYDRSVEHAVDLERYKLQAQQKIMALHERLRVDLRKNLLDIERESLLKELDGLLDRVREAEGGTWAYLDTELKELSAIESQFWTGTFTASLPVAYNFIQPAAEHLYAAAMSRPFQGRVLREWAQAQQSDAMKRVRDSIRLGFANGESIPDITRRVVGTRAEGYRDGILNISRRNATAVVRSAVAHTAATARDLSIEANADIIEGVFWDAVLDGRSTQICRARSGLKYTTDGKPIGHNLPWLGGPSRAHWQCRSTGIPFFDNETIADLMGERPQVVDTRTRRVREIDFRAQAKAKSGKEWSGMTEAQRRADISAIRRDWTAKAVGTVPASTNYPTWLQTKPRAFVEDVLGVEKARLFLDEGVPIEAFSDRKGGELTLKQLRQRLPLSFDNLGKAA
ncbi:MAG: hypothetical protein ACSHWQ_00055 [Spongiibacteraceae bacterium]